MGKYEAPVETVALPSNTLQQILVRGLCAAYKSLRVLHQAMYCAAADCPSPAPAATLQRHVCWALHVLVLCYCPFSSTPLLHVDEVSLEAASATCWWPWRGSARMDSLVLALTGRIERVGAHEIEYAENRPASAIQDVEEARSAERARLILMDGSGGMSPLKRTA